MAKVPQGQTSPAPTYAVGNPYENVMGALPEHRPAKALRETWSGKPDREDPAKAIPGMPPNMGEGLIPHVITFQGIISSVARVYRPSDEAIKDSYDNARFMLNDPTVMECVEQRQRSVALLGWHLEPEDETDQTAIWLAEQLTSIINKIPRFMQYRECLQKAIWYGKYANQHKYQWRKVRGKQRLCVVSWLPVNGDKLVFRYDDGLHEFDPNQVGIRVGAGFTTGRTVANRWTGDKVNKVEPTDYGLAYMLDPWERQHLAIHKHMIEDGEYEEPRSAGKIHGVGIRSRIYWVWYQKQEAFAWLMEYLERSAFGIEIWYYPQGNAQAEADMRTAAEERIGLGRNIIMVPKPVGDEGQMFGVERIEPGMQGAQVLNDVLTTFFGHVIKRYILGQTLTTEADATGLGSNLASVHLDTYLQIVKYDATNHEETVTTDLIDVLKELNFPQYKDVPINFKVETEDPDIEGKLSAYRQAFDMMARIKERDVLETIGVDAPEGDDVVLQQPQPDQGMDPGMMQGARPGEREIIEADNLDELIDQYDGDGNPVSANSERKSLIDPYSAGDDEEPPKEGPYYDLAKAAKRTRRTLSDAQRKAGNYRKGHVKLHDLNITIETAKNSRRRGKSSKGKEWSVKMPWHYGYFKGTKGSDGDHVDVFVGPDLESEFVYVVDQVRPSGRFDEHKVMIGFGSGEEAKAAYLQAYEPGWDGHGAGTAMTMKQFKAWLKEGNTLKAVAKQVSKYAFKESDHDRVKSGSSEGGQFTGGEGTESSFPLGGGFGAKGKSARSKDKAIESSVRKAVKETESAKKREMKETQKAHGEKQLRQAQEYNEWVNSKTWGEIKTHYEGMADRLEFKGKERKGFIRDMMKKAKEFKEDEPTPKPKKKPQTESQRLKSEARKRVKSEETEHRRLIKEAPEYVRLSKERGAKGGLEEPHQMTLAKWADHYGTSESEVKERGESRNETANEAYREHESWITKALHHKRVIPEEVLADYPNVSHEKPKPSGQKPGQLFSTEEDTRQSEFAPDTVERAPKGPKPVKPIVGQQGLFEGIETVPEKKPKGDPGQQMLFSKAADTITLMRAYYHESSSIAQDAFWSPDKPTGQVVVIEDGGPIRYTRSRHGQAASCERLCQPTQ